MKMLYFFSDVSIVEMHLAAADADSRRGRQHQLQASHFPEGKCYPYYAYSSSIAT